MIPMSLEQVARAIEVGSEPGYEGIIVRRVTTDSRRVEEGDLFFAIRGERVDGHQFVAQAAARGAVACVCAHDWFQSLVGKAAVPHLVVSDTVGALGRLAAHYRREVMPPSTVVVAITGSNGKTTTKGMIDHTLTTFFKGRSAPKSFNNKIGVPLTLLSGDEDDRYLVAEIGTNATGEVAALAALAAPDVAVITSIGEAHLQGLGDIHAIAAEKTSLLDHVRRRGFGIVNVDRPEIRPHLKGNLAPRVWTFGFNPSARLRITAARGTIRRTTFDLEGRHHVELSVPGVHHAANATAAFAVARWFGLAPEEIIDRLRSFTPADGRTRLVELGKVTVVDDSYNANPTSTASAIHTLRGAERGRRVLVMGDMFELGAEGPALHRQMVRLVYEAGIEVLVAVGEATVQATQTVKQAPDGVRVIPCTDATAASEALMDVLSPGDTVWVKASRAMELDRVVSHLKAHYPPVADRAAVA